MRVLLTGASGFLGKNLLEHLPKHLGEDYKISGIGSKNYDLRNYHACRKAVEYYNPDVIVHAAGSVGGIGANQENPGKFMYENLIMGTNLIEEARKQNVPKFVLLGTVCSYPKYTPTPFMESHLWEGYPEETNAPYGIAKKTLMRLLQAYGEQYGMRGANLIPVNMYGPHDHFNLTSSHVIPALILKFYNAIKNGESSVKVWGTGKASREFLYAPDCAEAIALAVKKNVSLDPINIGNGKEIKIVDLVTEIADQMNYKGEIKWQTDKPDGQPRRCLNTWNAKDKLNFVAKTDLKTGLKETIEWFLNDNNWEAE
jgi:GDP-L-fucose synthase|tara:strand:+ start:2302 stop:3240 length:939 start_codon:yes stop_codon:yes gene_type:complete